MKSNKEIVDEIIGQEEIPLKNRTDIPVGGMGDFLNNIVEKFYDKQVENFGAICEDCRIANIQQMKHLADVGHKTPTRMIGGKVYEGTTGWSKDLSFRHRWIVSLQLSNFMRNLIYVDFWGDENSKVRDKFMKDIIKGVDPYELLRTLRTYYGTNANPVITE